MLEDELKPYGCTITVRKPNNPSILLLRFTIKSIDIDQEMVWLADSGNVALALKPILNKLMSVLSNGAMFQDVVLYDSYKLIEFVDRHFVKLTPEAKLDSVLEYLNGKTRYDGQTIELKTPSLIQIVKMYFSNVTEWKFYLINAEKQQYVKSASYVNSASQSVVKYSLTIDGLTRRIRSAEGTDSVECFVAMSFDPELNSVYTDAIELALNETGFKALRVDKLDIASDRTINDEIIAGIKKSHFTIADFTNHKDGVYFEAGYALGRGKKVIYTCREDQITKAHFDIRNYQHIVWRDTTDLKEKLINKINAFIKD